MKHKFIMDDVLAVVLSQRNLAQLQTMSQRGGEAMIRRRDGNVTLMVFVEPDETHYAGRSVDPRVGFCSVCPDCLKSSSENIPCERHRSIAQKRCPDGRPCVHVDDRYGCSGLIPAA